MSVESNPSQAALQGSLASTYGRHLKESRALGLSALKVSKIDEEVFVDFEIPWSGLLAQSNSDPLFMSWPWLFTWWETWGRELGLELFLLGVTDHKDNLIGIAPLYRHRYRTPVGISVTRLHFLGNAWHISDTVRTEYVGLIALHGFERQVAGAVCSYLRDELWDEAVICDAGCGSLQQLRDGFREAGCRVSEVARNEAAGIRINTAKDFGAWLFSLGKNTRLKVYNRRKIFEEELEGRFSAVAQNHSQQKDFFKHLNDLHIRRWVKPCFGEKAVAFHLDFLGRLSDDQTARLSLLKSGGRVVAAQYDVEAGSRRYNLQSGFDEHFNKKLSLGYLHMGYAIESAFRNDAIKSYDLLAGEGKNTFYKERYKGERVGFFTRQYVRTRLLRNVYKWQAYLPVTCRRVFNRILRL